MTKYLDSSAVDYSASRYLAQWVASGGIRTRIPHLVMVGLYPVELLTLRCFHSSPVKKQGPSLKIGSSA